MSRTDTPNKSRFAGLVASAALAVSCIITPTPAQVDWTYANARSVNVPFGTVRHTTTYDARRQEIVLFGGADTLSGTISQNTWLWDGFDWRRVMPPNPPPARASHAQAYDRTREVVVLFGGGIEPFQIDGSLDDTWEWDGSHWTQRFPTVSPPPRERHGMAYDPVRDCIVLFGGFSPTGSALGDTWEWDGSNWAQLSASVSPSARAEHNMVYVPANQGVLLAGGIEAVSGPNLGDTWIWDGSDWLLKAATGAGVFRSAIAYDSARQRAVTFNGSVREWDGHNWQSRQTPTTVGTGFRLDPGLAYDEARRQIVTVGGSGPNYPNPCTWLYAPTDPADYRPFGAGCTGSAGTLSLAALGGEFPWIGDDFTLELSPLPNGVNPVLLVGSSTTAWGPLPLPFGLGGFGAPGCSFFTNPKLSFPLVAGGAVAPWTLPIPNEPAFAGLFFFVQGMVFGDPINLGQIVTSDAAELVIGVR